MTPERPCMGGFCKLRDNCERYTQSYRFEPKERICKPGESNAYRPMQFAGFPAIPLKEAA